MCRCNGMCVLAIASVAICQALCKGRFWAIPSTTSTIDNNWRSAILSSLPTTSWLHQPASRRVWMNWFLKYLGTLLRRNLLTSMSPKVYHPCRTSWGLFFTGLKAFFCDSLLVWSQQFTVSVEPWFVFEPLWQILCRLFSLRKLEILS